LCFFFGLREQQPAQFQFALQSGDTAALGFGVGFGK
jgi:hypothetical protein